MMGHLTAVARVEKLMAKILALSFIAGVPAANTDANFPAYTLAEVLTKKQS
jgi:hypothetical protein